MNRNLALLAIAGVLWAAGCHGAEDHGHPHGDGGHDHHGESQDAASDHGHDHGDESAERPDESVTAYQSGLELFMEYPAFVVGESSPLIAHFTDARDADRFHVVTEGKVTATLRYQSGMEERFVADRLLRDGIFKPIVVPTRAGKATLTLALEGKQVAGTVEAGEVVVYPTVSAAIDAAPDDATGEPTVPFLKEAQWKTQYATALAEIHDLQDSIRANGELKPVAGQAVEMSSPFAGRIAIDERVPVLGQPVRRGDLLARVTPIAAAGDSDFASIDLSVQRADSELDLAERELARVRNLLAAKAVPTKRLDEARAAREVAAAKAAAARKQRSLYRGAQDGGSSVSDSTAFELRAPIDGVVAFADVTPGAVVEPAQHLLSVVNPRNLWLEVKLYEADAPRVARSPGASFTVAGFTEEFTIDSRNGRLAAVGAVIDSATRTLPLIFEFENPEGVLKPGMFAKVRVHTGERVRALAIPRTAIVDDGGKPTVFVMEGGESFFKRAVRVGIRSGDLVEILEGVTEGERVVSRGAYEMKLSTATGAIPEHGHQH